MMGCIKRNDSEKLCNFGLWQALSFLFTKKSTDFESVSLEMLTFQAD